MLGGAPVAGIGFGIGIDRVALAVQAANKVAALSPAAAIIALGEPALRQATALARALRAEKIDVEVLSADRKIKTLLGRASKIGARFAVILGEDELKRGAVQLRDLLLSKQSEVAVGDLARTIGAALVR
jgi:histidyl-tRNA synthetase